MKSLTILKYYVKIVSMTKQCALCGNEIGSEGIGLFCSKSCYSKNHYKVNNIYEAKRVPLVCKNCGKETISKTNSKYCSRECHTAYVRAKLSKKVVEEIECLCCKNKYLRAHKAQKYCSNECRNKGRTKVKFNKPCIKCGKLFPVGRGKMYCSVECAPRGIKKDSLKLICWSCNKSFIGQANHKYCSKLCRSKVKNRKKGRFGKEGKVCEYCGFDDTRALQAHHINRSQGKGVMFLCANHHSIFHSIMGNGKVAENSSREEVLDILKPVEEALKNGDMHPYIWKMMGSALNETTNKGITIDVLDSVLDIPQE